MKYYKTGTKVKLKSTTWNYWVENLISLYSIPKPGDYKFNRKDLPVIEGWLASARLKKCPTGVVVENTVFGQVKVQLTLPNKTKETAIFLVDELSRVR